MSEPKVLVVYFSRTGNTRRLALEVARQLGADVEEIGSLDRRSGLLGYSRCCYEAWSGKAAAIRAPRLDPGAYDLVVVAAPVWVASLSSPARAYLAEVAPKLRNVAFVLTYGGSGAQRVLGQLEEVAGKAPVATLALRERELGAATARASVFVGDLRGRLVVPQAKPSGDTAGPRREHAA